MTDHLSSPSPPLLAVGPVLLSLASQSCLPREALKCRFAVMNDEICAFALHRYISVVFLGSTLRVWVRVVDVEAKGAN